MSAESAPPRSRRQPLARSDGMRLREEVRDLGDLQGDRPVSWQRTISRYREYIEDRDGVMTVFESQDGRTAKGSKPHRFDPEYSAKQYAKLKDLERGVSEKYGKRLHTAMLTLTASGQPADDPLPPADHLDVLLSSWDAVRRSLDRQLSDRRFCRLAILEPHPGDGVNNGYLHMHIAVFVEGKISTDDLAPVIETHVDNCSLAQSEAHDPTADDTISIRHAGADRADETDDEQLDELAIYLAEYLGTYGDDDPLEEPEHVQAANALLWATNRQRWRPCQTAQEFMKTEPRASDGEWEIVGIEKDGDLLPCDGQSGGVETFETEWSHPPPDAPAAAD